MTQPSIAIAIAAHQTAVSFDADDENDFADFAAAAPAVSTGAASSTDAFTFDSAPMATQPTTAVSASSLQLTAEPSQPAPSAAPEPLTNTRRSLPLDDDFFASMLSPSLRTRQDTHLPSLESLPLSLATAGTVSANASAAVAATVSSAALSTASVVETKPAAATESAFDEEADDDFDGFTSAALSSTATSAQYAAAAASASESIKPASAASSAAPPATATATAAAPSAPKSSTWSSLFGLSTVESKSATPVKLVSAFSPFVPASPSRAASKQPPTDFAAFDDEDAEETFESFASSTAAAAGASAVGPLTAPVHVSAKVNVNKTSPSPTRAIIDADRVAVSPRLSPQVPAPRFASSSSVAASITASVTASSSTPAKTTAFTSFASRPLTDDDDPFAAEDDEAWDAPSTSVDFASLGINSNLVYKQQTVSQQQHTKVHSPPSLLSFSPLKSSTTTATNASASAAASSTVDSASTAQPIALRSFFDSPIATPPDTAAAAESTVTFADRHAVDDAIVTPAIDSSAPSAHSTTAASSKSNPFDTDDLDFDDFAAASPVDRQSKSAQKRQKSTNDVIDFFAQSESSTSDDDNDDDDEPVEQTERDAVDRSHGADVALGQSELILVLQEMEDDEKQPMPESSKDIDATVDRFMRLLQCIDSNFSHCINLLRQLSSLLSSIDSSSSSSDLNSMFDLLTSQLSQDGSLTLWLQSVARLYTVAIHLTFALQRLNWPSDAPLKLQSHCDKVDASWRAVQHAVGEKSIGLIQQQIKDALAVDVRAAVKSLRQSSSDKATHQSVDCCSVCLLRITESSHDSASKASSAHAYCQAAHILMQQLSGNL